MIKKRKTVNPEGKWQFFECGIMFGIELERLEGRGSADGDGLGHNRRSAALSPAFTDEAQGWLRRRREQEGRETVKDFRDTEGFREIIASRGENRSASIMV